MLIGRNSIYSDCNEKNENLQMGFDEVVVGRIKYFTHFPPYPRSLTSSQVIFHRYHFIGYYL